MDNNDNNLRRLQRRFIAGAAAILPFAPFLLIQGQIIRWKVGLLPDAGGEKQERPGRGQRGAADIKDAETGQQRAQCELGDEHENGAGS